MTDAVAVAAIAAGGAIVTTLLSGLNVYISRKTRLQSIENGQRSIEIQKQTNGFVTSLLETKEREAQERERRAWDLAYEEGRKAEMMKRRRATDIKPEPANDEEPKE
jgi:hypothetical protein